MALPFDGFGSLQSSPSSNHVLGPLLDPILSLHRHYLLSDAGPWPLQAPLQRGLCEGDGVVRWPGARVGKEVVPVQGEDGVKERAEDMVGGGRGLETAKPVERKGHCLPIIFPRDWIAASYHACVGGPFQRSANFTPGICMRDVKAVCKFGKKT